MLNKVDLPQPDGPMIDTNSPGAIENETSSTAVITPSLVTKRLLTRSTSSRRASPGSAVSIEAVGDGAESPIIGSTAAILRQRSGQRGGIAPLHANVDDGDRTVIHRANRLFKRRRERVQLLDRAPALRTLSACYRGKIQIGIGDALADPLVLDRPVAHAGKAVLK